MNRAPTTFGVTFTPSPSPSADGEGSAAYTKEERKLSKDGTVKAPFSALRYPVALASVRDCCVRWLAEHPAQRVVVPLFVLSRVVLIATTIVGSAIHLPSVLSQPTALPLWRTWFRWDAPNYAAIAAQGYLPSASHIVPAFFPLFPLIERLAAPFVHGDLALAGLLISNVAWFVALCQIHALARLDFDPRVADGAALALSVFPTAFFGFVAYPEALFLAVALASLRQMRQRHWPTAAVLAALAALTRQSGIVLVLPFLCEICLWTAQCLVAGGMKDAAPLQPIASLRDVPAVCSRLFRFIRVLLASRVFRPAALAALIPLATCGYALWLWHAVGDPLAFMHAQATWHRAFAWPWQTLWRGLGAIFAQPSRYFTLRAVQEVLVVVGMGALCIPCMWRAPASYTLFAMPLWLLFLAQPDSAWPLLSQSRLMLECFPLIIILGAIIAERPRRVWLLVACCVPIQIAGIIIFSRAGWFI